MFPKSAFTIYNGKPFKPGKDAPTETSWTFAFHKPNDLSIWHDLIDKILHPQVEEEVRSQPVYTTKSFINEEEERKKELPNVVYIENKKIILLKMIGL